MDRQHCVGCRDNFYNGNNELGVKVCWMLKTAKRIKRVRVHVDERPPWSSPPILLPGCYTESRYIFVRPDDPSCGPKAVDAAQQAG